MPEQDFSKEGLEQKEDFQENEAMDSLEKEPLKIAEEVTGGEITADKEELQKIIERNRQQIEKLDGSMEKPERPLEQFDREKSKTSTASDDQGPDDEEQAHVEKHAQAIYAITDPEQQIEKIVQLAINRDPFFAVKVAKHLDDNYILNEVHDRLVEDQVREQLMKRGLLKEL